MGVDIIDPLWPDTRAPQRIAHRAKGTVAVFRRSGQVKGIARHAIANHFSVNLSTPPPRMLVLLEHEDSRSFPHDKTVTLLVPRARSPRRIIIEARRQGARRGETSKTQTADRRLGAATHHHIGIVEHNQPRGIADRMRAGRASGHDRLVWPGEAVANRHMAGGQIDQIGGDEKRRKSAGAALMQRQCAVRYPRKTTDPGADHDAGPLTRLFVVRDPTRILDGLRGCRQRIDDKPVHLALVFGRNPIIRVKQPFGGIAAGNLGSNPHRKIGDLERLDRADARRARDNSRPVSLQSNTEGRHEPHPGHDDAPHPTLACYRWSGSRSLLPTSPERNKLGTAAGAKAQPCDSIKLTASLTVMIFSAASSGISQPNSSSKAITSSTVSRLSAPRSSIKLAFSVTFVSSTPKCSTTIFLTLSETSLIRSFPQWFCWNVVYTERQGPGAR